MDENETGLGPVRDETSLARSPASAVSDDSHASRLEDHRDAARDTLNAYVRRREPFDDLEQTRLDCDIKTRSARDSYLNAVSSGDPVSAETDFANAKDMVAELWDFTTVKGRPFEDLLGLLEATTFKKDLVDFEHAQRTAIGLAFRDLAVPFIDEATVSEHRKRFAQLGIDILLPLQQRTQKRYRVTFEELE